MSVDNRGQISVEIVLLVGLSLIIVLTIGSFFGEDIELNSVMAAAKTGSIDASNDLAYNGTGNVIRFNNLTFVNGTVTVNLYSKRQLSASDRNHIRNRMLQHIAYTLNKQVHNGSVQGRYRYTVVVVNTT